MINENEEENKAFYKHTFDNVHASDELLRKVISMDKMDNVKKKNFMVRKIGYVAAAAIAIAASSNIVAFAATGETWVHKVAITLNGKVEEVEYIKKQDADGNDMYETNIETEDGETTLRFYGTAPTDGDVIISDDNTVTYSSGNVTDDADSEAPVSLDVYLEEKDDKVILKAGEENIDITDNFKEGVCNGSFELDGMTYTYTVIQSDDGSYNLQVSCDVTDVTEATTNSSFE